MARHPVPISTMVTPTWSCWASTAPMTRPSPVKDDDADCDRMPARLDGDADTRGAEQDDQPGVAEAVVPWRGSPTGFDGSFDRRSRASAGSRPFWVSAVFYSQSWKYFGPVNIGTSARCRSWPATEKTRRGTR